MKLTITQEHNDKSRRLLANGANICSNCPTAVAYSEAMGIDRHRIRVGYRDINVDDHTVARASRALELEIAEFTYHRDHNILGTFEVEVC